MSENYVILDCDTGIDDAWALLLLLKAEQLKKFKILGVTCVNGNTSVDNVIVNTLRFLQVAGRSDIPVFRGASEPIISGRAHAIFYGHDGFGDLKHSEEVDLSLLRKEHAVNAMYDFVCKFPGKVSIIAVGPLTNIALCLNMYSDFAAKVRDIFVMGGNMRGVGNKTRSAEFNFYTDPESAFILLNKATCPITILPWETCISDNNISLDWRFEVLGALKSKEFELLNAAEKVSCAKNRYIQWIPCDAILAAAFIFPEKLVKKCSYWHATVELHGHYTRGQVVLDHLKDNKDNVCVIEEVNTEEFKKIMLWTGGEHYDTD